MIWLTEVAPHVGKRARVPRPPRQRQQRREPRTHAPRAQARHRRRQDHRDGDAHRLADRQRRPTTPSKQLHARLPGRHAGPHDQGPPARAAAQRPRQLLRQAASSCPRDMLDDIDRAKIVITNYHAFKLRERIELSKGGRTLLQGRGRGAGDARDRGSDDPARHARSHGHEEHPRAQRRGAPLLPREAGARRRGRAQGRRAEGSREEQGSRAPLDLRPRSRQSQARPLARHRPVRDAVLPERLRLRRRARSSRGR